jgi:ubiquinone/menaquinone biosynthesis C-methylase UbiE
MNNREKQRKFLNYFKKGNLVLELGSGGGDFLGLCAEAGIKATGVDSGSPEEICDKFDIIKEDVRKFLKKEKTGRYDGVYARHIIEHFSTSDVENLLKDISRVLKKGGKLILIFPNMKNIHVAMYEFWKDPTHVRPYTGEAISTIAEKKGFKVIASGADAESWDNSFFKRIARNIRKTITGVPNEPPDYMMVLEK